MSPLLVLATCDLPAKAAVMNMVQYNGYYGCGRCLQQGIATVYIKLKSCHKVYVQRECVRMYVVVCSCLYDIAHAHACRY